MNARKKMLNNECSKDLKLEGSLVNLFQECEKHVL